MAGDYRVDVAVFGGGIGGLWTHALLRRRGYASVLIEKDALGAGQTLASQGMIHGGQKYRLGAVRSAVAEMPPLWDAALEGKGDVDLSGARTLSPCQYMWATGGFLANLRGFAASRITRGRTEKLDRREDWPAPLRRLEGTVYRLDEKVLDVKSVLSALGRVEAIHRATVRTVHRDGDGVSGVELTEGGTLRASRYLFCAGEGNEEFARALGLGDGATQRRPLQQVLVRPLPEPLFGHAIGFNRDKPLVTVTTHDGVGYLGGGVAEEGAGRPAAEAIRAARETMRGILPEADLEWAAFPVNRAEPFARNRLPEGPALIERGNAALGWPTKMTLAPAFAAQVLEWVRRDRIEPGREAAPLPWPAPEIGRYPWERDLAWGR